MYILIDLFFFVPVWHLHSLLMILGLLLFLFFSRRLPPLVLFSFPHSVHLCGTSNDVLITSCGGKDTMACSIWSCFSRRIPCSIDVRCLLWRMYLFFFWFHMLLLSMNTNHIFYTTIAPRTSIRVLDFYERVKELAHLSAFTAIKIRPSTPRMWETYKERFSSIILNSNNDRFISHVSTRESFLQRWSTAANDNSINQIDLYGFSLCHRWRLTSRQYKHI